MSEQSPAAKIRKVTRDHAAVEYARLLRSRPADWDGWPKLNAALIEHWSESGLAYIKRKAWALRG